MARVQRGVGSAWSNEHVSPCRWLAPLSIVHVEFTIVQSGRCCMAAKAQAAFSWSSIIVRIVGIFL